MFKKIFMVLFAFCIFIISTKAQSTANINCLKFTSTTAYTQALENYATAGFGSIEGSSTYQSMKSTFTEENVPEGIDPEDDYDVANDTHTDESKDYRAFGLLSDILNRDKVVIIGNWIVKVDLSNNRGLLLNTSFSSQYNDILNDNLSNTNIKVVGLDQEGMEYIDSLDGGTCARCTAGPGVDRASFFYSNSRKRLEAKVVYQRALIYFSLQAKGKCQKCFLRIWWSDGGGNAFMSNIDYRYSKCDGAGFGHSGDPCNSVPGQGCLVGYQQGSTTTYRPYQGSTGLPSYYYSVNFAGTHGSGNLQIQSF
jgi:hypothetical protein